MKLYDTGMPAGSGTLINLFGIYRPYLREFLDFLREEFDNVIIWSAGEKNYVEKMVEIMFPFREFQPIIIYTRDDCEMKKDNKIFKPLSKLFKDKRIKGKMNEKNTFVLDDRADTFSLNHDNGILIPEFESDMSLEDISDHEDDAFLKLMSWLSTKEVMESKDVRTLKKDTIFTKSIEDYNKQLKKERKKV
jgi:hypothetical protein